MVQGFRVAQISRTCTELGSSIGAAAKQKHGDGANLMDLNARNRSSYLRQGFGVDGQQ